MPILGVSWWRGYSSDGDCDRGDGGVLSRRSARVSGSGALSILSARGRGVFVGEDMVIECMMIEVCWVVMFRMALGCFL